MAYKTPQEAAANSPFRGSRAAREKAAQTPQTVRKAMLCGPRDVCGVTLYPLSLDTLWTMEAIGHPYASPEKTEKEIELTPQQVAEMVFVFARPGEALELASAPAETGEKLSPFTREALAFVRSTGLPLYQLSELGKAVADIIADGLAPAPGGGGNPKRGA